MCEVYAWSSPVQPCPSGAMQVVMLQRLCGAAGWDVPSLSVGSDLFFTSQNVSAVFEDQAFKTGI